MRTVVKYFPALLLGSIIGGCSMAGTGDYIADEYAPLQRQQMPHYYGANAAYGHAATPDSHAYGTSVQGHQSYGQQAYRQ